MKQYTKPEIRISMFDVESISANGTDPLSTPAYGNNLDTFIKNNQGAIKKQYDFNDAIKFN